MRVDAVSVAAVPEPFTWATGFAGLGFTAYRRNNQMALNAASDSSSTGYGKAAFGRSFVCLSPSEFFCRPIVAGAVTRLLKQVVSR